MILTVLKVIGIILLIILAILIFILGLLLFVPIRYRFESSFYSQLQAEGMVKWMPVLFKATVSCEGQKVRYVIKLFGQIIMTNTDEKVSWLGRKFFSFNGEDTEEKTDAVPVKEKLKKRATSAEEDPFDFQESWSTGEKSFPQKINRKNISVEKEKKDGNGSLYDRIQKIIRQFYMRIHVLIDKLKEINKKKDELLKIYHTKRFEMAKQDVIFYGKEMFLTVKPDELEGLIHFGLEDPAVTGQILGILGMVLPIYDDFLVIQPDFEQACFEGKLKGKGKIRLFPIVRLALKVIFNKNLIKVTKKVQTIIET